MSTRDLIICLLLFICDANSSHAQEIFPDPTSNSSRSTAVSSTTNLPGEQMPLGTPLAETSVTNFETPSRQEKLAELMRPTFTLVAEWQTEAADFELVSYDAKLQVPTFPIFGPPPPFVHGGFSYAELRAPDTLDMPTDLYDYSLGCSWMRPIDERWMLRFMFSTAIATDGKNYSSDAWRFRGGLFATYRPNDKWTWILGALALGRNDIPAVPAFGAIWQPNRGLRFDLTLPKPRIAFLLVDNGPRQQWGYIGAGFNGGTWAFERAGAVDDQLTYRDWRVVLGWESTPSPEPGMPFTRGRKLGAEIGYVFSREFEFDSMLPDIPLEDTLMLRASMSF